MDHEFSNRKMFQSISLHIRKNCALPVTRLCNRTVLASCASAILFHCSPSLRHLSNVPHITGPSSSSSRNSSYHSVVCAICVQVHLYFFLSKCIGFRRWKVDDWRQRLKNIAVHKWGGMWLRIHVPVSKFVAKCHDWKTSNTQIETQCFSDRASWIDYTLITNLMHWLLFIRKILLSSTCW